MQFKTFVTESVVTNKGVYVLNEGIEHIEALPLKDFIDAVRKLSKFTVTEKLDGSNLIFGIDMKGKLYTSREAKSGGRFYSVNDYSDRAAENGMKSVHAALEKALPKLKQVLKNGDKVEVELLFGRQPNAIVYGSNYIAFLRMLPGDNNEHPEQDKIKTLADVMKGVKVNVTTSVIYTEDGIELKKRDVTHTWKFTSTSFIDSHHFEKVDVSKEISELESYLHQQSTISGFTNMNLMGVNLTSVPKEQRAEVKEARQNVIDTVEQKFKLPIKEKILDNILRKLKPDLQDVEIEAHENVGVEGVVALDPATLKQFKIVDKDVFTLINQFNYAIRNEIKATVAGRVKFDASITEADIFGDMLKRIANVIGIADLGTYTKIKRTIKKFAGADSKETLKNFTAAFKEKDVNSLKEKVIDAINEGLADLSSGLQKYNKEWKNYSLKLKDGRVIKYTNDIHDRTLTVFAEVRQEMKDMRAAVNKAKDAGGVAVALYGKQLKGV